MPNVNQVQVDPGDKTLIEKLRAFLQIKEAKVPEPAENVQGFLDYHKTRRAEARRVNFASAMLDELDLPLDLVTNACAAALGQKETDDLLKDERQVQLRIATYVSKQHRDALKDLSKEDQTQFLGFSEASLKTQKKFNTELLEKGTLQQHEIDEVKTRYLIEKVRKEKKLTSFLEALIPTLPEETKDIVDGKISSYKDVLEQRPEQRITTPYQTMLDGLSQKSGLSKECMDAIEYAKENLTDIIPEYREELYAQEKNAQAIESAQTNLANSKLPTYEHGRFHDMFQSYGSNKTLRSVKEGREQDFDEMLSHSVQLSDKTKQGLLEILEVMKEMELEKHRLSDNGEDPKKCYAFTKLYKEREAFLKALEEGDEAKIIETRKAYEKTTNGMQRMFDIAREHFNQQEGIYPGNMDSIRTAEIPHQFTTDLLTTAQVNAIYLAYLTISDKKIDPAAYVENPNANIMTEALATLEKNAFEKYSAGLSLEDTIDLMSGKGRFAGAQYQYQSCIPTIGISRNLALAVPLETDPSLAEANELRTAALNNYLSGVAMESTSDKFTYLQRGPRKFLTDEQYQGKLITIQNLVLASDQERNANALFGGAPATNYLGRKIGEPFDTEAHLTMVPMDYEGFLQREKIVYDKFEANDLGASMVVEALTPAFAKILASHPQDAATPGYKAMEKRYFEYASASWNFDHEEATEAQQQEYEFLLRHTGHRIGSDPAAMIDDLAKCIAAHQKAENGKKPTEKTVDKLAARIREDYALDRFQNQPEELRKMLADADTVKQSFAKLTEELTATPEMRLRTALIEQRRRLDQKGVFYGHGHTDTNEMRIMREGLDSAINKLTTEKNCLQDDLFKEELAHLFTNARHYADEKRRKADMLGKSGDFTPSSTLGKNRLRAADGIMDAIEGALDQNYLCDHCYRKKMVKEEVFGMVEHTDELIARGMAVMMLEDMAMGRLGNGALHIKDAFSEHTIKTLSDLIQQTPQFGQIKQKDPDALAAYFGEKGKAREDARSMLFRLDNVITRNIKPRQPESPAPRPEAKSQLKK